MSVFHARHGQVAYGYAIGVLCAEWHIPFIPGDLNNANTFDFPVRYLSVPGASGSGVLKGSDPKLERLFVEAAQQLESEGIRAITGNCGFMGAYQQAVADAVSVPVFMSSLIQAPLVQSMLGTQRKLGVLVANGEGVTDRLLVGAGITDLSRITLAGLERNEHWNEVILQELGTLDEHRIRSEVVASAVEMTTTDPSIGALLLECSDLPPYSAAVAKATGLPVYDWAGFIRFVYDSVVPRTYGGIS